MQQSVTGTLARAKAPPDEKTDPRFGEIDMRVLPCARVETVYRQVIYEGAKLWLLTDAFIGIEYVLMQVMAVV